MATSTSLSSAPSSNDIPTWDGLKRAIVSSSGFQRWCIESDPDISSNPATEISQEQQVMTYLRETLETLAY
ncbi:MAG: hypothetical protein AAGD25_21845 [Cyanobacteria bacterium P01_F01_bin.150]